MVINLLNKSVGNQQINKNPAGQGLNIRDEIS